MIGKFLKLLAEPAAAPVEDSDGRAAFAALLVRIARADGHFDAQEAAEIDQLLARRYHLSPAEAEALREQGTALEAETGDTVALTAALKQAFDLEARHALLEDLWTVVLADGQREAHEDQLMRLAAHLLGITDRDSALARQRASAR